MKTICFPVEEDVLLGLHVQAARSGCSMQEYVLNLIQKDLHPKNQPKLTSEQLRELHSLTEQMPESMEQMQFILQPEMPEMEQQGGMHLG